jgi:uncharacterized repeat protein (TIGR01451 family)
MTRRTRPLGWITAVAVLATIAFCLMLALLRFNASHVTLAQEGPAHAAAPGDIGPQATEGLSGTITVGKVTEPSGSPQEFEFLASYSVSGFTLSDGVSSPSGQLEAGTYWVTETVPAGWDLTDISCQGGLTSSWTINLETRSVEIALAEGDDVTCLFTNTERGTIVIEKQTLPDGDTTTLFDFTGALTGSLVDGVSASKDVEPGTHTVTEGEETGWDLTAIVCDDADSSGDVGARTATFEVDPGETVTCVFTNTAQPGSIMVEKQTLPGGDTTTLFDFTGALTGSLVDGGTASKDVEPGTYTVTEGEETRWDLTAIVCDDADSSGDVGSRTATFEVDRGETVTCVFTNTEQGRIVVDKVTDPSGAAQAFDFDPSWGSSFELADGDTPQDSGPLSPGTYNVTETVPAGWELTNVACTAGTYDNIVLEAGETVTCTFTNTERGTIVIEKQTDPAGGTGFAFTDDIEAPFNFSLGGGGTKTFFDVEPATYTVREVNPLVMPGSYALTNLVCVEDGTENSTTDVVDRRVGIALEAGETVTCTFTNSLRTGQLEVVKVLQPYTDWGRFSLQIDGVTDPDAQGVGDGGSTGVETVPIGGHTVGETGSFGTRLDAYDIAISCVDEGGTGTQVASTNTASSLAVTVNEDDYIVCTITNIREADLTISKTGGPSLVNAGETLIYAVQVDNDGPAEAQQVVVTDPLPDDLTYEGYEGEADSCTESPPGMLTCHLGTLQADQSASFDIITRVRPEASNIIHNTITVDSATRDPVLGNNHDTEVTLVEFNPVIKVEKIADTSVALGDTLVYLFTLTNDGVAGDGSPIMSPTLSDDSVDPSYFIGDRDGDNVLDPTESWRFIAQHTVGVNDPDPLINTATASGLDLDGDVVTGTDTHTTNIQFEPAITVEKTGPAFASLGDRVVYTFTVSYDDVRGDGSPIHSVAVTDTLAGEATFVRGDANPNDLLEPAETWIFTATHTPASAGRLTNTVTASGRDRDGDSISDTDDHTVIVYGAAIEVEKTGPTHSQLGGVVVYTVTITNATSPADAPALVLESVTDDPVGDLTPTATNSGCGLLVYQETCSFAYTYTLPLGDTAALTNTVEARYHSLGYTEPVTDAASHALEMFQPVLQVTKTGPKHSEVGDVVAYTVTITNASSANAPILSLDSISDSLKGDLTSEANVVTSTCTSMLATGDQCQIIYTYTVQYGDSTPLVNSVWVESQAVGVTNVVTASAEHPMGVTTFLHLPLLMSNDPPPWEQGTGLPTGIQVRTLAVCVSNPNVVYAGFGLDGHGIYKSVNAGRTWAQTGLQDAEVFGIAVAPGSCNAVYAGAWEDGVMKSVNGGISWDSSGGPNGAFAYSVVIDPLDSGVIYAGTALQGVYRSRNAGASWESWGLSGLTVPDLVFFAPPEQTQQVLYAATWEDGVYKRPRSGTTWGAWTPVSNGIAIQHRRIYAINMAQEYASTVFAATYAGGLYRTLDGGGAWTQVLPSPSRAYAVVVDPASSDIVYVGTQDGGVYQSRANGDKGTWHPLNVQLGSLVARSLAIGPASAEYVHVGTAKGAWRRPR